MVDGVELSCRFDLSMVSTCPLTASLRSPAAMENINRKVNEDGGSAQGGKHQDK